MKRTAILTGATGYIGSNLVKELLLRDWHIVLLVRRTASFQYIDAVKNSVNIFVYDNDLNKLIALFKNTKPDVVFHLASKVIIQHNTSEIEDIIDSNIRFSTHLLEAMRESQTENIVSTGSSWQHFQNEDYNPVNLYAATKEAFAAILKYYTEAINIRAITLELFETYGPDDCRPKVLNLIKNIEKNKLSLEMSPGGQELNFVYIDDVVKAYIKAAEILLGDTSGKVNKTYSICSNETMKLSDIIGLYEAVNNVKLDICWGGRSYRFREVMSVWDKGETLPGWTAEVKLKDGLKMFREYSKGGCS